MDLDTLQEDLGGISRYQVVCILAAGLFTLGSGFTTQSSSILSAIPDYRCSVPPIDDGDCYNFTEAEIRNLTIPFDSTSQEYDSCSRYNYNLSACSCGGQLDCLSVPNAGVTKCGSGYWFDTTYFADTTISEWNLVCDRQYLDSLANTIYFLGLFFGSLVVGPLSDWFGRKISMLVCCVGLIATGVGSSFAPTFELYVFTRFLVGLFAVTCFVSCYVYAIEICDTKRRTDASVYINASTAISHSIWPGIGYAVRGWRTLLLIISFFPAIYLVVMFFIPESPRWLLSVGKYDKAKKIVSRYASSKGKVLDDDTWEQIVKAETVKKADALAQGKTKIKVWDLFRLPIMRIMSLNVMFSWFTISMVFYGLALNGGNLAGDPYLNLALNGVVEIAAYIFIYVSGSFGRRPITSGSYILAGIACIVSMLFDIYAKGNAALFNASTAFAIIGKFFASLGFGLVYAVTAEIFPTDARATGLSLGSMAARVGGMISPFILQAQTTIPWLTQTLFGSLSILSGLLFLCFPETNSVAFLDTIESAETFYRDNSIVSKFMKYSEKRDDTSHHGQDNAAYFGSPEQKGTHL